MSNTATWKMSENSKTISMTDNHVLEALTNYLRSMSFINDDEAVVDFDLDEGFKVMAFVDKEKN